MLEKELNFEVYKLERFSLWARVSAKMPPSERPGCKYRLKNDPLHRWDIIHRTAHKRQTKKIWAEESSGSFVIVEHHPNPLLFMIWIDQSLRQYKTT